MNRSDRRAAAPVVLPEPWGVCVGSRIWIGRTPEHVLKLAEREGIEPTLLYTEQQVRAMLALSVWHHQNRNCITCNDHGAVGNILTAEPCPDCTTQCSGSTSAEGETA